MVQFRAILISLFLISFGTVYAEDWQKASTFSGSPFDYVFNSNRFHGGPSFYDNKPKGPFSRVELNYYSDEIAIEITPNNEFKKEINDVLNAYIEGKLGVEYRCKDGEVVSKTYKDDEERKFTVTNKISQYGYFHFQISILPKIRKTGEESYYSVPITDYGATDIVAGVLHQMSTYEGKTFYKNVYKYSLNESTKTKHFKIRNNNLTTVGIFADILDFLYDKYK